MKTANLIGRQLDWAVAKAEGKRVGFIGGRPCYFENTAYDSNDDFAIPDCSTDWEQGGPIIEQARLCIDIGHDGVWLACSKQNYDDVPEFMCAGPTPLIAAMRCFVTSKMGPEIEIPLELQADPQPVNGPARPKRAP